MESILGIVADLRNSRIEDDGEMKAAYGEHHLHLSESAKNAEFSPAVVSSEALPITSSRFGSDLVYLLFRWLLYLHFPSPKTVQDTFASFKALMYVHVVQL